jgi:hypothetical protein
MKSDGTYEKITGKDGDVPLNIQVKLFDIRQANEQGK